MTQHRKAAAIYLSISLGLVAIALLGTLRVPRNGAHRIWPIHTDHLLPLIAIVCAYVFLGVFLVLVVTWIVAGEQDDD